MTRWRLSSSSDRVALDIVDGTGMHIGAGPHYSRRTPGSRTFTGVGQEIVLVTDDARAVWAVVYQRTPSAPGSGSSRGRSGQTDAAPQHLWRNMMFRNLGAGLSSELICDATWETYRQWIVRYGQLPNERMRTEIDVRRVRSSNPGYCYERAGWKRGAVRNGKRFFWAPTFAPGDVWSDPSGQLAARPATWPPDAPHSSPATPPPAAAQTPSERRPERPGAPGRGRPPPRSA
jgi:hypothetical protein